MKKIFGLVAVVIALALIGCAVPTDFDGMARGLVWNGEADREVAVDVQEVRNTTRTNASANGEVKITSNAHSAAFPGIYFIWDAKQKDNGYLKVAASVFDKYASFTLTAKMANEYWDFPIALEDDQEMTADGCYVFFIPKVTGKNINMVFIGSFVLAEVPEINLGFIGWYPNAGGSDGVASQTSFYWQNLKKGETIDWDAVDAAYADWVAKGGFPPNRETGWQTSGFNSFVFEDYAALGIDDFSAGQLEGYYRAYYVDPGYIAPKAIEFEITVFHRVAETGAYLVYPNVGETFASTQEGYIEWLNNVDGFTFVNLYLAAIRNNDPASMSSVEGYVCSSVAKNNADDASFDIFPAGEGADIEALIKPVANGHYQITFWYDAVCSNFCAGCEVCLDCNDCECYVCASVCEGCDICIDCGECVCFFDCTLSCKGGNGNCKPCDGGKVACDCTCKCTLWPGKGCQDCQGNRLASRCDGSGCAGNGRGPAQGQQ